MPHPSSGEFPVMLFHLLSILLPFFSKGSIFYRFERSLAFTEATKAFSPEFGASSLSSNATTFSTKVSNQNTHCQAL
jgi:hypothetical protein